ncbi:unnamed protein product [Victoria cruziana]
MWPSARFSQSEQCLLRGWQEERLVPVRRRWLWATAQSPQLFRRRTCFIYTATATGRIKEMLKPFKYTDTTWPWLLECLQNRNSAISLPVARTCDCTNRFLEFYGRLEEEATNSAEKKGKLDTVSI